MSPTRVLGSGKRKDWLCWGVCSCDARLPVISSYMCVIYQYNLAQS